MFLFHFSILLAICSSAFYHFTAKSTPGNVNCAVSRVNVAGIFVCLAGLVMLNWKR
jgi:hypothetical protein